MQMEVMFNVRAQDNTGTVVKMGGDLELGQWGALAFAQNISFTMKTI